MTLAFKEWAFIVDALGKGMQCILLRKGGIAEENGEFEIKGKKFVLYPTLFHQNKNLIKDNWLPNLEEHSFHPTPNKVNIHFYAEVVGSRLISDWNMLEKLDSQHAWKEEIVKERFNRWEKNVHLLLLQVNKLNESQEIEILPQYEGCKSWIDLEKNIALEGKPIIYQKIRGTYF